MSLVGCSSTDPGALGLGTSTVEIGAGFEVTFHMILDSEGESLPSEGRYSVLFDAGGTDVTDYVNATYVQPSGGPCICLPPSLTQESSGGLAGHVRGMRTGFPATPLPIAPVFIGTITLASSGNVGTSVVQLASQNPSDLFFDQDFVDVTGSIYFGSATLTIVPEPSTGLLLSGGLALLALYRNRRCHARN